MSVTSDRKDIGGLGYPSKMPGTSYGIPAEACKTGAKLRLVEGSTCFNCYAFEGNYLYPSVAKAEAARLESIKRDDWAPIMARALTHMHSLDKNGMPRKGRNGPIVPGWHRWHDAGDVQSVEHLAKICEVARLTPQIWHWLPMREYAMLKAYLAAGGDIPENLCIRVSAPMIDGAPPSWWPQTSTVHDTNAPIGHKCPAPTQDNYCGECRACWNREVGNVSYHLH